MDKCKVASVAIQQNVKFQSDDGSKEVDATLYRQMVGSFIYLTATKPELAYLVSVLSQFMKKTLENHWMATKVVLRYLQGTIIFRIKYTDSFDVKLVGYSRFRLGWKSTW